MTQASTKTAKKRPAARASSAGNRTTREWKSRRSGALHILEAPELSRLKWLAHGFSTRLGGSSQLEHTERGVKTAEEILNLGFTEWDQPERVSANRQTFFSAIGAAKMRPVLLRQIHSDIIRHIDLHHVDSPQVASDPDAPRRRCLRLRVLR